MAVNENVNVNVNVNTQQFDKSLEGMKQEFRELEKVDLTILSPEQAKQTLKRMGDLKAGIKDIEIEIDRADTGNFFGSFTTLAGPAIASISAISLGMESFGVESEKVEKIQRKLMATIGILSSLQTVADAHKLKSLLKQLPLQAQDLKNRLANILLIKQETKAIIAKNAAQQTEAKTIKTLTVLQRIWNKAVAANPILILVAAIAALVAGVVLLTKAFRKNNSETKESEKALDGVVIKNKELRDSHNATIRSLRDMDLEMQKLNGTISDQAFELLQLQYKYEDLAAEIDAEYLPAQEEAEKKSFGFFNSLKNSILSIGNPYGPLVKNAVDYAEKVAEIEEEIVMKKTNLELQYEAELELLRKRQLQRREQELENANKSIMDLTEQLNDSLIKDETKKLQLIRDKRIENVKESGADIAVQTEAIKAIWANYYNSLTEMEDKYREQRKTELDNLVNQTKKAQAELDKAQFGEDKLNDLREDYNNQLKILDERLKKEEIKYEDFRNQQEELTKAYEIKKQTIEFEATEEKHKKLLAFQKDYLDKTIEEKRKAELDAIQKAGSEAGASPEEIEQAKFKVRKKYIDMIFDYEKDQFSEKNQELINKDLIRLQQQYENEEEFLKAKDELLQEYAEKEAQRDEIKRQSIDLGHQIATEAINVIMAKEQAAFDEKMKLLDSEFREETNRIDDMLKYGQISDLEAEKLREDLDKKRAQKEKELAIKKAKDDKKMALFQIAIDTAAGVIKALPNLVLSAFVAAAGVASALSVSAQPLPAFRTGSEEPFEETGNAYIHQGEMVIRPEGVSYANNEEIIRRLNDNPYQDLGNIKSASINFETMVEYVDLAFNKYRKVPVVLNVNELQEINDIIVDIESTSEV